MVEKVTVKEYREWFQELMNRLYRREHASDMLMFTNLFLIGLIGYVFYYYTINPIKCTLF